MAVKKENEYPIIKITSSNIIMISDMHWGRWSSSEEWQQNMLDYFKNWFIPYVKKVKEERPDVIIFCLGDVYNDEKSIEICVMNLCAEVFEELSSIVPIYMINGNHDLSKMNRKYSSLKSLDNTEGLTIIRKPTLLHFLNGKQIVSKIMAIPYLGDCNEENKILINVSGKVDYAFMHTEITGLKFDNGMTIVGAVDSDKFSGKIFAGHIHKRQEGKNVTYVGSPYHLDRGDCGNTKGIYLLNLESGDIVFTENTYSPQFIKIEVSKFANLTDKELQTELKNNIVEVLITDEESSEYKQSELYDKINKSGARKGHLVNVRTKKKKDDNEKEIIDYDEINIEQLISEEIDKLENTSDEDKAILHSLSTRYLNDIKSQLEKEL